MSLMVDEKMGHKQEQRSSCFHIYVENTIASPTYMATTNRKVFI